MFFQISRIHPLFPLFKKGLKVGSHVYNTKIPVKVPNRTLTSKSLVREVNDIITSLKNLKFIQSTSTLKYLDDNELKNIPRKQGIFQLQNNDDVVKLIKFARRNGAIVRVMGAGHSVQEAIYSQNDNHINVTLGGELRKIHSMDEIGHVSVGAGCNLGIDPNNEESTLENSFNFQVDQKGYALPILGGISHQTIGGFLQTSTAGGSLKHTIADSLEEIEFINGKGEIVTLNKRKDEEMFNASVVSMGLFGIITRANFNLTKNYLVEGTETNHLFEQSVLVNEGGHYKKLLEALENTEYFHLNWFPQPNVKRTIEWRGKQVASGTIQEYNHPLKERGKSIMLAIIIGGISNFLKIDEYDETAKAIIGELLDQFIPVIYQLDDPIFRDKWYKILPNDDQADTAHLIKTSFTEMWFPLDKIDETMKILEKLFNEHPSYIGNFAVELYGAKKSPFWMSPSYGHHVFRVDSLWWAHNIGNPREFFEKYWEVLLPISGARLHWGKYKPEPGKMYGKHAFGIEYLRSRYPRLDDWLKIREEMDPDQIFVNDYWRKLFNIESK
ncbi:hypothetical protein C1645_784023 [Glomus cerebriforme]|uniref:D-arabinono-1,4-lactone oxidase n=1 Tax=Glomus cerebriforme TaxID=658196 RepID=A0A397SPA8_9GLOM|nr:hypothetical protein C1645_784023 [Glomus cerebriforme]